MDWKTISTEFSNWFFLLFIGGIPLFGYFRKVKVYESFVDGAKEGFQIAIRIIPYLVAIIVVIGMLRAAGAFKLLTKLLGPFLNKIGFHTELLPLALMRPFSGSASLGIVGEIAHTFGGNSFIAHVAATMMGSTETTFYVIAVYFGAVNIYRTRYAIPAGLLADLVGMIMAVVVTRWLYS